ncbi:MAG: hypothetical protein IPG50_22315 [Myxococcales bacterium]|nr:hypothetical protein [Myxococcales bacterium]
MRTNDRRIRWMLVASLTALAAACTLNPQPIPPGLTEKSSDGPDAGAPFAGAASDASTTTNPSDPNREGGVAEADASPPSPLLDAGVQPSDAGADATLDAGADATGVASSDGGDAG